MKQHQFVSQHALFWDEMANLLSTNNAPTKQPPIALASIHHDFPTQFRKLCHHLSVARSRGYSHSLTQRLENLVFAGYQILYRRRPSFLVNVIYYLLIGFPQRVRTESTWVVMASCLFFIPLLLTLVGLQFYPELVYLVINSESLLELELMYQPGLDTVGRIRDTATNIEMFGFYVFNNTSIGFKTFASGLFFGIGSAFFILYNGLHIGAAAGHLTYLGYTETFWPFVASHSALEISAIIFSGACGLKLGMSLVLPGQYPRSIALKNAATQCMHFMYGVAVMFILAAIIEAFWSSSTWLTADAKFSTGIGLWIIMLLYFCCAGRRYES